MDVEGDTVDDGGDQAWVGEDGSPFAEGQVGSDADAGALLAFGDDLEQKLCSAWVDLDIAQLVEQEKVEAAVAGDDARQLSLVGGLDEFVDQLGGRDVADPASLLAGVQTECDEQMTFPVPESPSSTIGSPASM